MKICITGGLGYIGRHLVENLCKQGHDVIVIDKNSYGKLLPVLTERYANLSIHITDLFDMELVPFFYDNQIETVIHLASETNNPELNVLSLGAHVWTAAAMTCSVNRFINISDIGNSDLNYEGCRKEPLDYIGSKRALEYRIAKYMDNDTKTFNVRIDSVYGHSHSLPFSDHKKSLWFDLVNCVNTGDTLNLPTSTGDERGTVTNDWINIFDVVEIISKFATHSTHYYERTPHWVIGIGEGCTAYNFTRIFNTIEDVAVQINFVPNTSQDIIGHACDPRRAFKYLDFRSKVGPRIYSNSYLNGVYLT